MPSYNAFVKKCKNCQSCELSQTRIQVVVGQGPVPCNVMVIGEAPGEQEDIHGRPFIGKAGQLLTKLFESAGINRESELYITNTVKCRPPKNRTPLTKEINACNPHLQEQFQWVKPKIVLLLGAAALKTILKNAPPITKSRGKWIQLSVDYMTEPVNIMPLFHPSYLLRNSSNKKGSPKWLTEEDLKEVKRAISIYSTPDPV